MEDRPHPDRKPVQKSSAVRCVFPGIWFYFLESPGLIGRERHKRDDDTLVLHYCHEGRVSMERMQARSSLASGDIWIVPKLEEAGAITLLSKRYSGVSMLLNPKIARDPVSRISAGFLGAELDWDGLTEKLQNPGKVIPDSDPISRVFSQLFVEKPPYGEAYFRLKAMELLLHLSAFCVEREGRKPLYLERELVERVDEARQFLTEHLDCRLTQAQIAKQFHLSLTALKRTFQSMYGLTLDAYLREQRIAAAKQMLLETELPVSEIAHRVGYESHSQFTSMFHSHEGQSPAEYRGKRRKKPPM